jgi:dihydroorotate dehydrogenase electron transfer subunit
MKLERATVVSQEEIYANTYLMWLSCPAVAKGASPGRFFMLHCSDSLDPLLPRPMSFHRFRDAGGERQFAILYDVRGLGTTWLSQRTTGDEIDVFGPLGRGYQVDKPTQHLLLVAGGLGVAAVVALADQAIAAAQSVTLLQGARSEENLFPPGMLPKEVEAIAATDDGSAGHNGVVTDLLEERMPWADQVFACGPTPMFVAMAGIVREMRSRKPIQALLEERMGCGTGVCYGCAVFTPKGVRLVCKDGPRFELTEAFR